MEGASLGDGNIAGNVKGVGGLAPGGADGPGGGLIKTFGSFFSPICISGFQLLSKPLSDEMPNICAEVCWESGCLDRTRERLSAYINPRSFV